MQRDGGVHRRLWLWLEACAHRSVATGGLPDERTDVGFGQADFCALAIPRIALASARSTAIKWTLTVSAGS